MLATTDWLFILLIVAVVIHGTVAIVKAGTRYSENIERMKNGYPLRDGTRPSGYIETESKADDLYQPNGQPSAERY